MDLSVEAATTIGLLLLFLTHFYIPILDPVQTSLFAASSDDQTILGQGINLGVWSIAGCMMMRHHRLLMASCRAAFWTLAFAGLAVLSALWSQDASITLRKSSFLLLTTAFGIFFARRFSMERQMQLISAAGGIAAVLSIVFALFLPAYGLDHDVHEGVWLGIFTQKNVCAREMLFLLASIIPFKANSALWKAIRILAILTILAVIIGTRSKTALLIMAIVCLIFPAILFVRSVSKALLLTSLLIAVSLVGFAAAVAASAMPQFVAVLGRDSTMTGRTDIWKAVLQAIFKHPLLGYGFAAFWLSLRGESANLILALRWAVPAAHNGFLDIWLQMGAAGLLLFLVGFVLAFRSAMAGLRQASYGRAAWPCAVLILTLVYNLDESSLMQPNDFLWVLYVATLVNLAPSRRLSGCRENRKVHLAGRNSHLPGLAVRISSYFASSNFV